jgi:cyclomaltodextrinase
MDKYKAKPSEDSDYKINKPDDLTRKEQIMFLIHQFTFIGAPQIWYGEEVGMWGADDPDCRKPMVWEDIKYEPERAAYDPAISRSPDSVKADTALRSFYTRLCAMRRANPVLVYGDLKFTVADDKNMLLGYRRTYNDDEVDVIFNRSGSDQIVNVPVGEDGEYTDLLSSKDTFKSNAGIITVTMESVSGMILKKKKHFN